jgi:putative hydrolase of the HAD superfamily
LTSQQVGTAVLDSARKFWTVAEAEWRLKLDEARLITVRNGFATLAAGGQALPDDLAIRLANRFTTYREEEMSSPARTTPSTNGRRAASSWRW